ncbi:hypothetical protein EVAR_28670_1 [Eumeta japonica]|uniref:Uncharacterized protein n=1 Tax=Eumeta variegata TaxID=151549 RepID=A0A4C1V5L1_EUMVA|nr:hypothetical protein EVAR_28670_1 [Eumeta japonica]
MPFNYIRRPRQEFPPETRSESFLSRTPEERTKPSPPPAAERLPTGSRAHPGYSAFRRTYFMMCSRRSCTGDFGSLMAVTRVARSHPAAFRAMSRPPCQPTKFQIRLRTGCIHFVCFRSSPEFEARTVNAG